MRTERTRASPSAPYPVVTGGLPSPPPVAPPRFAVGVSSSRSGQGSPGRRRGRRCRSPGVRCRDGLRHHGRARHRGGIRNSRAGSGRSEERQLSRARRVVVGCGARSDHIADGHQADQHDRRQAQRSHELHPRPLVGQRRLALEPARPLLRCLPPIGHHDPPCAETCGGQPTTKPGARGRAAECRCSDGRAGGRAGRCTAWPRRSLGPPVSAPEGQGRVPGSADKWLKSRPDRVVPPWGDRKCGSGGRRCHGTPRSQK